MGPFTEASTAPVFHLLLASSNSWEAYATFISAGAAALSALATLVALLVTRKQMAIQKDYTERLAKPKLVTFAASIEQGEFLIDITNVGLGPAIIKDVQLTLDGKLLAGEGQSLMQEAMVEIFPNRIIEHCYLPYKGDYIDPKTSIALLKMPLLKKESDHEIQKLLGSRLQTLITFESIYGKTYTHNPSREE